MKYVTIQGDTAVIAVTGRYTIVTTLEVAQELKTAFSQFQCSKVVADFADTTFIDSSVERQFIKVRRQVGAENFSVVNAKGAVLAALRTGKLDSWIQN